VSTARGRILATVTVAQLLSVASATVVAVALPGIGDELRASGTEQQWVVDAFVLVFASLLVAGGVVGDRRGRRLAFLAGLGLFAGGSLWCALAPSVEWLLAGRVVQALGPPLVLPASLAIVTATYPDAAERARAVGIWAIGSGTGVAAGPVLGGLLVDGLGWRWVFGANVVVALVLVAIGLRSIPRDRPARPAHRFDGGAAVLLTAAVALLVFGLIEGRELGWGSAPVLVALGAAAALTAAFVRRERRHPAPLVDLGLLARRPFLAANVGGATLYGALTASAVYVSIFLQQVQGRSALETGLVSLPQGLLIALCAPLASRATARMGPRLPILAGMGVVTVAFVDLLRIDASTPVLQTGLAFAVLGIGTGLALPAMTITALDCAPGGKAGMASAIHNASRQLGQTFAVAVLGTVIFATAGEEAETGRLAGAAAAGYVDGLQLAMLVCAAGLVAVAAAVAVLVPRRRIARAPA
jgi:DHA2 family methylenomycin A resistance protein-like MFS transporter